MFDTMRKNTTWFSSNVKRGESNNTFLFLDFSSLSLSSQDDPSFPSRTFWTALNFLSFCLFRNFWSPPKTKNMEFRVLQKNTFDIFEKRKKIAKIF